MLGQRIATAIVLLAILLPALFYHSPAPFCAVALVLIAAAGWEWGRLNGCSQPACVLFGLVLVAFCSAAWGMGFLVKPMPVLWVLASSAWVLLGTVLWGYGLWWVGLASLISLRYFTAPVPFNPGWWAYVFPLGVFTLATMALAEIWGSSALHILSITLVVALCLIWLTVALRSIAQTVQASGFAAPAWTNN